MHDMTEVYILHTCILFENWEKTTILKFLASKIIFNVLMQCTSTGIYLFNFFFHVNQTIFISVTGQIKQIKVGYLKQMS